MLDSAAVEQAIAGHGAVQSALGGRTLDGDFGRDPAHYTWNGKARRPADCGDIGVGHYQQKHCHNVHKRQCRRPPDF